MLTEMEVAETFDTDIPVPSITSLDQVSHILKEVKLFSSEQDLRRALNMLEQAGLGNEGKLSVGVKKLLSMAEMARQDPDCAEKLVGSLVRGAA